MCQIPDLTIAENEGHSKFSVVDSSCFVLPAENSSECIDSLLANPTFLFSSMTSSAVCPEISLVNASYLTSIWSGTFLTPSSSNFSRSEERRVGKEDMLWWSHG